MRPLKERVSITVDSDIVAAIHALADESARPFSQYINLVLRNHLRAVARRSTEGKNPLPAVSTEESGAEN